MKKTTGTWDYTTKPLYFCATNPRHLRYGVISPIQSILLSAHETYPAKDMALFEQWLQPGSRLFIDSGVHNLVMTHAYNNGLDAADTLRLSPEDVDGFPKMWRRYWEVLDAFGTRMWGVVEIDQGGIKNKIRLREKIEARGVIPIPVYHVGQDPWSYLHDLCADYDRVCVATFAASTAVDPPLLSAIHSHTSQHPDTWIHMLGLTPSQHLNGFPFHSCDSAAWISSTKWEGTRPHCDGAQFGSMPESYRYDQSVATTHPRGNRRASQMAAYEAYFQERCWRAHMVEAGAWAEEPEEV